MNSLSIEARGVLSLAQDMGEPLTVAALMAQGWSERKSRAVLRELVTANRLTASQTTGAHGRFQPATYSVTESDRAVVSVPAVISVGTDESDRTVKSAAAVEGAGAPAHTHERGELNLSLNTNTKDSVPDGTARLEIVKSGSPRNDWYDAVCEVWGYSGALNTAMAKMLQGKSTAPQFKAGNVTVEITPDDLRAWAKWYRETQLRNDPDLNMLEDRMKIASSIANWHSTARGKDSGFDLIRSLIGPNGVLVGVPGYDPALGAVR